MEKSHSDLFGAPVEGIEALDKDGLARYAKETFGLELDLAKSLKALQAQVKAAQKAKNVPQEAQPEADAPVAWYRHVKTGRVWPARAEVIGHPDWLACREDGSAL